MKTTDIKEAQVCKICLERDSIIAFISPCHCKGSIKYVHPHCMAGWRKSLLQTGRESDLYHCQICKHRLKVKQKRIWVSFLRYKVVRFIVTVSLLGLILIPLGSIMKAIIHFPVLLINYPGGLTQAWANNSLMRLLYTSSQSSLVASFSFFSSSSFSNTCLNNITQASAFMPSTFANTTTAAVFSKTSRVLYSPFPVCFISAQNSPSHALFSNNLLYYFTFPFSDKRLWQLILCKLEHFHLGFFLLGSVNNICFTYKILNDMFDIVLLGQDNYNMPEDVNEIAAAAEEEEQQHLDSITRRLSKLLKGFLLVYCCSLVVLFWVHFNIFAFHVDTQYEYNNSKQFVAELPLWTLRWVTLGIAVGDFAARGIYRWLTKLTNCIDQEDVLSLTEENE